MAFLYSCDVPRPSLGNSPFTGQPESLECPFSIELCPGGQRKHLHVTLMLEGLPARLSNFGM